MSELTEKRKAFALAYVANGGNGAQAVIEAGYNYEPGSIGARVEAHRILQDERVQQLIQQESTKAMASRLPKALAIIDKMMDSDDLKLAHTGAKEVMDRGGLLAGRFTEHRETDSRTDEEIAADNERLRLEQEKKEREAAPLQ